MKEFAAVHESGTKPKVPHVWFHGRYWASSGPWRDPIDALEAHGVKRWPEGKIPGKG